MRFTAWLWLIAGLSAALAQNSQPLETPYTPFDFDNYRRTPLQARQTSTSWASRDSTDLQRGLISGERGKKQDIATRAAALFPDPKEIPIRQEPEPVPTPNQLTDEITSANYGVTTKGQRDLLVRGQMADRLNLSSMSEADYELYVAKYRADQKTTETVPAESLLRPMPTLINSKTGGPPHAYAVSQAGIGARKEPRDNQNPFEGLIRSLRLDQPVTKGTDSLPKPSARPAAAPALSAPTPTATVPAGENTSTELENTQP